MSLFILSVVFGFICFFCALNFNVGELYIFGSVLSAIGFVISTIAMFVSLFSDYFDQIEAIEELEQCRENKKIYKKKRDELADVFKQHLASEYPDYEKEIFSKLIPENITAVATMFPEIKASETIVDYCNKIYLLTDKIYDQDLKITENEKDIRIRLRDKTSWWFLIPEK